MDEAENHMRAEPVLSIVIVAFHGVEKLQQCLQSLREQTQTDAVEVRVVTKQPARELAALQGNHCSVHWLVATPTETIPTMRARGILTSRGSRIALLEDDCIVAPGWVAAALDADLDTCRAVGGPIEPGAYADALNWALYYCEFGRFLAPFAGVAPALPGNNVCYPAQALPPETMRDGFYETRLHTRWQSEGGRLMARQDLCITNNSEWRTADCVAMPYHHGRAFAAQRFGSQLNLKRLLYALLALVLPVVKTLRTLREVIARRRPELPLLRPLPWIILFHSCWSVGELAGYLSGPGNSIEMWS